MALHVPKAPGFAQMLKDGAKVGGIESLCGGRAGPRLRRPRKACKRATAPRSGIEKVLERELCSGCPVAETRGHFCYCPSEVGRRELDKEGYGFASLLCMCPWDGAQGPRP